MDKAMTLTKEQIVKEPMKYPSVCTSFIHFIILCGILFIFFGYRAYEGKSTPFSTIENMQIQDSLKELAEAVANLQDMQTSLQMEFKDLKKKK